MLRRCDYCLEQIFCDRNLYILVRRRGKAVRALWWLECRRWSGQLLDVNASYSTTWAAQVEAAMKASFNQEWNWSSSLSKSVDVTVQPGHYAQLWVRPLLLDYKGHYELGLPERPRPEVLDHPGRHGDPAWARACPAAPRRWRSDHRKPVRELVCWRGVNSLIIRPVRQNAVNTGRSYPWGSVRLRRSDGDSGTRRQ